MVLGVKTSFKIKQITVITAFFREISSSLKVKKMIENDPKLFKENILKRVIGKSIKKLSTIVPDKKSNVRIKLENLIKSGHWWPEVIVNHNDIDWKLCIVSGNPYSGTLHSFIGHADQWKKMSNRINQLLTQMSDKDLQLTIIDKVQKSQNKGNKYLSLLAKQTTIHESKNTK